MGRHAASTNCSSHVNYYSTLRTYLSLLIHWKQREKRSKLTEERHSRKTARPWIRPRRICACSGEKLTWLYNLPVRARARSTALWLFRLFSRHISRTQSFQENHQINFQARVLLKPLVSLIGRLVACGARIAADGQTDTHTHTDQVATVTLAAHAGRGL